MTPCSFVTIKSIDFIICIYSSIELFRAIIFKDVIFQRARSLSPTVINLTLFTQLYYKPGKMFFPFDYFCWNQIYKWQGICTKNNKMKYLEFRKLRHWPFVSNLRNNITFHIISIFQILWSLRFSSTLQKVAILMFINALPF